MYFSISCSHIITHINCWHASYFNPSRMIIYSINCIVAVAVVAAFFYYYFKSKWKMQSHKLLLMEITLFHTPFVIVKCERWVCVCVCMHWIYSALYPFANIMRIFVAFMRDSHSSTWHVRVLDFYTYSHSNYVLYATTHTHHHFVRVWVCGISFQH